ncbi:ribonuclease P protein component 1 [Caldiplasma sukawensis]
MDEFCGEYLGKYMEVTSSKNPSLLGVKGTITWETKNMLYLNTGERTLMIPKNIIAFRLEESSRIVDGRYICYRPEERLKSYRRIKKQVMGR